MSLKWGAAGAVVILLGVGYFWYQSEQSRQRALQAEQQREELERKLEEQRRTAEEQPGGRPEDDQGENGQRDAPKAAGVRHDGDDTGAPARFAAVARYAFRLGMSFTALSRSIVCRRWGTSFVSNFP